MSDPKTASERKPTAPAKQPEGGTPTPADEPMATPNGGTPTPADEPTK